MSWAGYSIGAIRRVESNLAKGGLIKTCKNWDVTHDIGLGLHTWMHSIQIVDIKMGDYGGYKNGEGYQNDAVIWHKAYEKGMKYDSLFELIYNEGEIGKHDKFNIQRYISQERKLGKTYNEINRVYPNGGIKNTLFYRNIAYHEAIASQVLSCINCLA
jgi:hypothetical protein